MEEMISKKRPMHRQREADAEQEGRNRRDNRQKVADAEQKGGDGETNEEFEEENHGNGHRRLFVIISSISSLLFSIGLSLSIISSISSLLDSIDLSLTIISSPKIPHCKMSPSQVDNQNHKNE
ncbi:hypothetical protein AMTR_s00102p00086370 [Amborella trichopoda]|uniref:Uncharacterized protein n=1 Tax=Amborella trichopoda TaxID=13333 RepID=W1P0R1_AMBTC|nr:hypothetical protein AMTR_s00102p00086370 [Amborella trichopoda]